MSRRIATYFLSAFLLLAGVTEAQRTWYVDGANPNTGTGSLSDPFATIQAGIAAAQNQDRVSVAPGTYVENLVFLGRDITVESLLGASVTTIDGSACVGIATVAMTPTPGGVVLRGFAIKNGCAGISCDVLPGSLSIEKCIIEGHRGSGIRINRPIQNVVPSIVVSDCLIQSNVAFDPNGEGRGGGLFASAFVDLLVERTVFLANRAGGVGVADGFGGAVQLFAVRSFPPWPPGVPEPRARFKDCTFLGNTAVGDGGSASGGAIEIHSSFCEFDRCRFEDNGVLSRHFATRALGGAIRVGVMSDVTITRSIFERNYAASVGTALSPIPGFGFAEARGGAIAGSDDAVVRVRDCFLRSNSANATSPFSASAGGAAIWSGRGGGVGRGAIVELEHVTVVESMGPDAVLVEDAADLWVRSAILYEPSSTALRSATTGIVDVRYSDVSGGWSGAGNLAVDPQFVNATLGDFRLSAFSPCIDRGDPAIAPLGLDYEGMPRFQDGDLDRTLRVDMGAHEFSHVRLDVSGSVQAGGPLTFDASGTNALPFVRFVGVRSGAFLLPTLGPLYFDPSAYWAVFHTGTIPNRVRVAIPFGLPRSTSLYFQDLAVQPSSGAGNTSNPVLVVIE